jgi:Na+-driven multidrug efflux pump
MISEEYRGAKQWSRNKQAVFTVVWISFLCAAVGTMVFFALFDPVELSATFDEELNISHDAGYAAGFFFFWLLCAICSGVTAFLVRTAPKRDAKHRQQ